MPPENTTTTTSTATPPATPPATTPPATTSSATTETPPATPPEWTSGFNDETKGYVQNKGWKGPGDLLESYRNSEKLISQLAGNKERIVTLPETAEDPKWAEVYERLGMPKDAKEYVIPEGFGDEKASQWAREMAHTLRMPKTMADQFFAKMVEYTTEVKNERAEAQKSAIQEQEKTLKSKWGAAYNENVGAAKTAAKAFGLTGETLDKLEQAMGYAGAMEFMHNVGARMGEATFVDSGNTGGGGNLTPEAARDRIAMLKKDTTFATKYLNGDAAAKAEMDRLHKMAAFQG